MKTLEVKKIANAMLSDRSRDMWSELKKMKGSGSKLSCSIDGKSDSTDIVNVFSDKYRTLYNSVPYGIEQMNHIENVISDRLEMSGNDIYSISVDDVMNTVSQLKSGKCDGYEGLHSDHVIHDTHRFYVLLSILYTAFLIHGFTPDSMILGTMIPIP